MNNFELIDEYITNRLNKTDRESFEEQMKSDSALKADVELQTQIIDGLKKARVAELKSMLNKVPVTGGGASTIQFSPLRIAAGLVGTAVVVSAIYLYFKDDKYQEIPNLSTSIEDSIKQKEQNQEEIKPEEIESNENSVEQSKATEGASKKTVVPIEVKPAQEVSKPALNVIDPSSDLTESTATRETGQSSKPVLAVSKMEVEVDSSNKKYSFHYQFANTKMILFGSFDKSLFEILQINGNVNSTFLFYKENFYLLDDTKTEITPLEIIRDKALIVKLKEYRKK